MKEDKDIITKEEFFTFIQGEAIGYLKKNAKHGDLVVVNDEEFFYFKTNLSSFVLVSRREGFEVYYESEDMTENLLNKHSFYIWQKTSEERLIERASAFLREEYRLIASHIKTQGYLAD